jgi:hypothetical protein
LDIRVVLRDSVSGDEGIEQPCIALIAEFGSPNGMVIFDRSQWSNDAGHAAEQAVGAFSTLGPEFAEYQRDRYIDALRHWGWFGQRKPPSWYRRRSHP